MIGFTGGYLKSLRLSPPTHRPDLQNRSGREEAAVVTGR